MEEVCVAPPVIVPVGEQQLVRGVSLWCLIDLNDFAVRFAKPHRLLRLLIGH